MKIYNLAAFCVAAAASAVLLGAMDSARADQWFVMGEQTLKSADPSAEITTQGNRWQKDVKKVKLSVEGALTYRSQASSLAGTIARTRRSPSEP